MYLEFIQKTLRQLKFRNVDFGFRNVVESAFQNPSPLLSNRFLQNVTFYFHYFTKKIIYND
jgi:hypothetical protein